MALVQRFSVSQSEDASVIYLNDETGDYDASDNPGGYGTPNTARADLALIVLAAYKASTGDEELTPSTYDPESVEQWEYASNGKDGHFQFDVYPVAKKTGAETPSTNDFVYDFSGDQLQRWNGSAWVSAEDSELEDNDEAHTTVDYPILALMWIAFNNLNKLSISGCKSESKSDIQKYIMDTENMLNGVIALFAEGSYAQAQENIEKYQSRVDYLAALS